MTQNQEVALKDAVPQDELDKSSLLSNEEFANRNTTALVNIEEDKKTAQLMCKAKAMLPEYLHGNPGECLAIVLLARDWGMNPYTVGQHSYIPQGSNRVGFDGQLVNAAINNSRRLVKPLRYEYEGEGEDLTCTAYGMLYYYDFEDHKLKKEDSERSVKVSMPKNIAKQGKKGTYYVDKGNSTLWDSDPEQQLAYKAARWWCRKFVPEILMGVYTPQEVTEMGQQHRPGRDATESPATNIDQIISKHREEKEEQRPVMEAEIVDQKEDVSEKNETEKSEDVQNADSPECSECQGRGVVERVNEDTGEFTKEPCPKCPEVV